MEELRRTLRAYGRKLVRRHRSRWFAMPLAGAGASPPPGFSPRLVLDSPDRVLEFIRRLDIPGTCDPVEIRTMRERGHLLVGLEGDGELVGFCKLGWEKVYVLDFCTDLELLPGDFFVIESYIVPSRRRLGAGTWLIQATNAVMHRRGFARRISHVETGNLAMLRTAARAGYRPLGEVEFVSVLGRKFFRPHPSTLWVQQVGRSWERPLEEAVAASAGARGPHRADCYQ